MTTNDAARLARCTRQNVWLAIKQGKLRAAKVGRDWWIMPADLERWLDAPPNKGGRPRKAK